MSNIDPVTEVELKAKATGRRVTLEDVNEVIASEHFVTAADGAAMAAHVVAFLRNENVVVPETDTRQTLGLLTFCVLVLTNGYTVTGQSACADPNNYNQEIGQRIAREDAVKKIWPLLGFELSSKLAAAK